MVLKYTFKIEVCILSFHNILTRERQMIRAQIKNIYFIVRLTFLYC